MSILKFLFYAPSTEWIRFTYFFFGILFFIAIAEKTRIVLGWSPEINRKLVHILTGILIFFSPYFFTSDRPLIWMAVIFIIITSYGVKTGKLKGMHDTRRISFGTVFYPTTYFILVITCWNNHKAVLVLSMLILGLADAAAALVGENLKHPHEYNLLSDKKSVEGSSVMFFTSFLLIFLLLPLIDQIDGQTVSWNTAALIGLATAITATALESVSSSGSDNLSAPLGSAFVLNFMFDNSINTNLQFIMGLGLGLLIAIIAYRSNFLTASGSVITFLLAALVFGIGGWVWTVPILTFFFVSSLLSKIGKEYKTQFMSVFEKSSCRDFGQVLANGGTAGIVILIYSFIPNPVLYKLYLGALASVNADTWATEIGVFSKSHPVSIKNFKKVLPGTSGGITFLGTSSAAAGSFIIALSGWIFAFPSYKISIFQLSFWIIVIGGFLASIADSFLGATVQAQYRCPVCSKITERKLHCKEEKTQLVYGYSWFNNDMVNAVCSVSGVLFVWLGICIL